MTLEEIEYRIAALVRGRATIDKHLTELRTRKRELLRGRPTYKVILAEAVRGYGAAGATSAELAAQHPGIPRGTLATMLSRLVEDGTVVYRPRKHPKYGYKQHIYTHVEIEDEPDKVSDRSGDAHGEQPGSGAEFSD